MSSIGPNLAHTGWMRGRHWAVMYKCYRCGHIEAFEYEQSDNDGNLQCQPPPEGWTDREMLLCPNCTVAFKRWMEFKGVDA